jgi:hypothetical protein
MMFQGFKDIFTAVTSAIKGVDIDWKQWGIEKFVSYGTNLLLAGWEGVKDAGQALNLGTKEGYRWI